MFKSLDHGSGVREIHGFITFLKTEILLFIEQCPPNFACDNGKN